MSLPRQCEYASPLSRLSFIIHLPELHALISFIVTIIFAYFLNNLPSHGTFSMLLTLVIGLTLTRHMSRGGRSFVVDSHLQHAQQIQQLQQKQLLQQQQQQQQLQQQQQQQHQGTNNSSNQNTILQIPPLPLSDKVAIITGASSGLGLATAQLCVKLGIYVIFAVRDLNKIQQEIAKMDPAPRDGHYSIIHLDLNDLDTVPRFVDTFSKIPKIGGRVDYLINNAGAMVTSQKLIKVAPVLVDIDNDGNCTFSPIDGDKLPVNVPNIMNNNDTNTNSNNTSTNTSSSISDSTNSNTISNTHHDNIITHVDNSFCTNHLGHFLLVVLLLPYIIKSSSTRIINVSSAIHVSPKQSIRVIDCLMHNTTSWDAPTAYGNTKLCNIWFTQALQRRLDRITTYSPHHNAASSSSSSTLNNNSSNLRNNNINNNNNNNSLLNGQGSSSGSSTPLYTPATFAVHPGTVWSPFHMPYYRDTAGGLLLWFPLLCSPMAYFAFKTTTEGAMTTLHCCLGRSNDDVDGRHDIKDNNNNNNGDDNNNKSLVTSANLPPQVGPQPGQYHADCRVVAMSPVAAIERKQEELWELSLLLCRKYVNPANYPLFNALQHE